MCAQLLQKYIAYARTYVSPVLSDEAAAVLREFYLQLRRQATTIIDGAPVTVRPPLITPSPHMFTLVLSMCTFFPFEITLSHSPFV